MTEQNTLDELYKALDKISEYNKLSGRGHGDLEDTCYICGISPAKLKTLFTEHSKQEVELAKLQMSADIFTQFKDAIMRQDLSPRPIHGTRFLTPLEELALILERQAPLSKRNK